MSISKNKINTVIIDYGLGNLFSVLHACEKVGINASLSSDKKDLLNADAIILPGVGAFGKAMKNLAELDLIAPIQDKIASGTPTMAICLGLQLLFSESEEYGLFKGLNVVNGVVKKLPSFSKEANVKVPHIGWNSVYPTRLAEWPKSPLKDISEDDFMYFVHSYYVKPSDPGVQLSVSHFGQSQFTSSILAGNVFATQFHPEKSGVKGLGIYRNWMNMVSSRFD